MTRTTPRPGALAVALGLGLLLPPVAAHAAGAAEETDAIAATYQACMDAAGTTVEYTGCSDAAREAADALLNTTYMAAVAQIGPGSGDADEAANARTILDRLKAAQRAWIAFRDAECLSQASAMLGGTGENQLYVDCLYHVTADRAVALEEQFDTAEQ